jgi:hypothetical protein
VKLRLAALLLLVLSLPAQAEIVVLSTGEFLKVEAHQIVDGKLVVELPGGGTMTLELTTVERVLEDELLVQPGEQVESLPGIVVGFAASQSVPDTPFGDSIYSLAEEYGLNPRLIAAVVRAESSFDPQAISSQGAQGLMQIMPATADRFGVEPGQVFDPETNLETGIRYLSHLSRRYEGDLTLMLAAYNAGEATVQRFGGVPPYRETQEYIRRIERFYLENGG